MQIVPLKITAPLLTLPLVFCATLKVQGQSSTAPMQVIGPNPTDFEFRADGTMIAKGVTGTGSLLSSDQGAGTRLLWFPNLGAFRAGTVSGSDWDLSRACHELKVSVLNKLLSRRHEKASQCNPASVVGSRS